MKTNFASRSGVMVIWFATVSSRPASSAPIRPEKAMVLNSAVSPVSAATAFMKSTSKPCSTSCWTKVKGK